MTQSNLQYFLKHCQQQVDTVLDQLVRSSSPSLEEAMRYSVFNGGKRIRPALCYASADLFGQRTTFTDRAAAAVEMIHAYSLIHDDLPAMDDDDLRRGKPTCHIKFGEAIAILAGDGLQSLAFDCLLQADATPDLVVLASRELARSAGVAGMVAGQATDLDAVDKQLSLSQLEAMHNQKTGALINASVRMGALSTGRATTDDLDALQQFSHAIGLAFQVQDDILDEESTTEALGKQQGADRALNKPTYTSLLGVEGAKLKLQELHNSSLTALQSFGDKAAMLRELADFVVNRNH